MSWRDLVPWWAWLGTGLLLGAFLAAVVLQALVILGLLADVSALHGDVCRLAVTSHVVIVGCK